MNKIYKRGVRKEYKIVQDLKAEGFDIVQRSAGSHSPIDIFAIKIKDRLIKLVQSKRDLNKDMSYIDNKLKEKIEQEHLHLNGSYTIIFEVR